MNERKYALGAIPSEPDERDWCIAQSAVKATFPKKLILPYLPTIRDQGDVGSCVAHSIAYVNEYYDRKKFATGFIYGYRPDGYYQGVGMIPREACETARNQGNVLYDDYIKNIEMQTAKRDVNSSFAKLLKLAEKNKINSYAKINNLNELKTALTNGMPAIFCAPVDSYEPNSKGIFSMKQAIYGYHEQTIFGWDNINGSEYFYVANSWGKNWGKNGFSYVSARDIFDENDVYTIADNKTNNILRRTLKLGVEGSDVLMLEERLNDKDIIAITNIKVVAEGKYTDFTKRAVEKFQKVKGINPSGTVGTATWRALGL